MKQNIIVLAVSLLLAPLMVWAGWETQTSGVGATFYDAECVSANECWAVGAGGTILHTTDTGQHWASQSSGVIQDLYGVDFVDSSTGWAVGSGPTILHTTDQGATWTPQAPGTANDLMDVAFANPNRGWASGVSGTIIGTTNGGSSWSSEITGVWGWFWGVTAASPTSAWVTGGDWFNHVSPIYHYNGSSWTIQYNVTTTQNGQDLSAADPNAVWFAGDSGHLAHTTNGGTNWTNQTSGFPGIVNGIRGVSANACWAVGAGGAVSSTSDGGATWRPETTSVTDDLYGITMNDSLTGWAVGANGRILHRIGGGAGLAAAPDPIPGWRAALQSNPVRSAAVLRLAECGRRVSVSLYSPSGRYQRLLYSGPARSEMSLRLDGVPAGVYLLIVRGLGRPTALRLVKTGTEETTDEHR